MVVLKNDILPAAVYNTLPNIRDVFHVPEANSADIADFKDLLNKYDLSDKVRIKLVHIHFRLKEGEVFAAREIEVPGHGNITIMQPFLATQQRSLYGYHYFVDDEGNLSAYEYMEAPGPDFSEKQGFIQEFCQLVQERGLQRKLGLSLRCAEDNISTHEIEFPAKRTCIDVPFEIPLPYSEDSFDTMTEFIRDWPIDSEGFEVVGHSGAIRKRQTKSHTHHTHHRHTDRRIDSLDNDDGQSDGTISDEDLSEGDAMDSLYVSGGLPREIELAGSKLDPSSGLFEIVSYITDNV